MRPAGGQATCPVRGDVFDCEGNEGAEARAGGARGGHREHGGHQAGSTAAGEGGGPFSVAAGSSQVIAHPKEAGSGSGGGAIRLPQG